jgi:hypothetical protein
MSSKQSPINDIESIQRIFHDTYCSHIQRVVVYIHILRATQLHYRKHVRMIEHTDASEGIKDCIVNEPLSASDLNFVLFKIYQKKPGKRV